MSVSGDSFGQPASAAPPDSTNVQKGGRATATFMPGALFQLSPLGQVLPKGPPPRAVDVSVANWIRVQVCLHEQWCDAAFHHVFNEQFTLIRSMSKRVKGDSRTGEERLRGPEMQEANKELAEIFEAILTTINGAVKLLTPFHHLSRQGKPAAADRVLTGVTVLERGAAEYVFRQSGNAGITIQPSFYWDPEAIEREQEDFKLIWWPNRNVAPQMAFNQVKGEQGFAGLIISNKRNRKGKLILGVAARVQAQHAPGLRFKITGMSGEAKKKACGTEPASGGESPWWQSTEEAAAPRESHPELLYQSGFPWDEPLRSQTARAWLPCDGEPAAGTGASVAASPARGPPSPP